jgi:hypothetical protein
VSIWANCTWVAQLRLLRFLPQSKHQRPLQLVTVAALGVGLSFTRRGLRPALRAQARSGGGVHLGELHVGLPVLGGDHWQTHVQFAQMDTAP